MIETLYNLLSNYAPLTSKIGTNCFYNFLPEGFDFDNDAVIFSAQLIGANKDLEGNVLSKSYNVEIKVFSRDTVELFAIAEIIEELVTIDQTNVFNGVELERETPIKDPNINAYFLPLSFTATVGATIPALSDYDRLVSMLGRGYCYPMPTGQTTIYRTGDDAYIEANVFAPVRASNSKKILPVLIDFFTLANNNVFGNTNRFTDDQGGQDYANDYVIDHYTGLGLIKTLFYDSPTGYNWENAIDLPLSSTDLGFNDWFLPNSNQLGSLHKAGATRQNWDYAPFNWHSGSALYIWGATTQDDDPTKAQGSHFRDAANFGFVTLTKISASYTYYVIKMRKHF